MARRFGQRFWLETGIYCSAWNNRFQKPSAEVNSLSYLGFGAPLQLNFNYLQKRRFTFYVGSGMNYEYLYEKTQSVSQEAFPLPSLVSIFPVPSFPSRIFRAPFMMMMSERVSPRVTLPLKIASDINVFTHSKLWASVLRNQRIHTHASGILKV
jgi:hypothetical protein